MTEMSFGAPRRPMHPKTRDILYALRRAPMRRYDIPDIAREQLAERGLIETWTTDVGAIWVRLSDEAMRS